MTISKTCIRKEDQITVMIVILESHDIVSLLIEYHRTHT